MNVKAKKLQPEIDLGLDTELIRSFRDSLGTLATYAAAEGLELKPYQDPNLAQFQNLPEPMAKAVQKALREYCDVMSALRDGNEHLLFNLNSVWLALRKLGLTPLNDLFPQLQSTDMVEIYNPEGIQVFRSFHFFKYCSYDLETLFCRPWFELFLRDESVNSAYMSVFQELIAGKIDKTTPVPVPSHLVYEINGSCVTRITPKIVSPLPQRYFIHAVSLTAEAKQA